MSVTRRLGVIGAAVAMAGALAAAPAAVQGAEPQQLKMASFNVGGSWYIYATTIADLARKALPEGSTVEVLPYQGGVGNPILVNRGDADLALSFSALGNWAYTGKVTYKEPHENIRALVGGLNTPHRLAVVAQAGLDIDSLADIDGKPVHLVTVQVGGAGEALARMALEAYGMSYDDINSWGGSVTHTDLPVAIQRLRDGQADLFIHNVGYRQPDVMELALGTDLNFIPLGDEQMSAIVDKYGLEPGLAIQKGEFEGVDAAIVSVGYPTGVIANASLSDDAAYTITKAICEHPDVLAKAHASLKGFDPDKAFMATKNGNVPLHPGAERYYREKGLM